MTLSTVTRPDWAPKGREGWSPAGPKGQQLEVGAWRAPKLLVINNVQNIEQWWSVWTKVRAAFRFIPSLGWQFTPAVLIWWQEAALCWRPGRRDQCRPRPSALSPQCSANVLSISLYVYYLQQKEKPMFTTSKITNFASDVFALIIIKYYTPLQCHKIFASPIWYLNNISSNFPNNLGNPGQPLPRPSTFSHPSLASICTAAHKRFNFPVLSSNICPLFCWCMYCSSNTFLWGTVILNGTSVSLNNS